MRMPGAIVSHTTPTLDVFVDPDRRRAAARLTHPLEPRSASPFRSDDRHPAKSGVLGGTTIVTPVRARVHAFDQRRVADTYASDRRGSSTPFGTDDSAVAESNAEVLTPAHDISRLDRLARTEERNGMPWARRLRKAVDNFPVSGEPIPAAVARWPRTHQDGRRRAGERRARSAGRRQGAAHSPRPATGRFGRSWTMSSRSTSSRPVPGPRRT